MTTNIFDTKPPRAATCETHGDYTSRNILGGVWTKCPTCAKEEQAREQAETEAKERRAKQEAWARRIGESGIPERFRNRHLSAYVAETEPQQRALAFAQGYADGFAEVMATGRCALFIGRPGTGKTHLAIGIGLEVMGRGHTVLFATVARAIRRVKDTWNKGSRERETQAIAALTDADLLILDEIGVQFGSETERMILFDVLNERYERRRPTILLSNLTRDDREEGGRIVPGVKSFLGERIYDRLREDGGRVLAFDWPSYRGRASLNNQQGE